MVQKLWVASLFLLASGFLYAQGFTIVPDPEGVYVDPEGVVKARKVEHKRLKQLRSRAAKLPSGEELSYISVSKLFAEAREILAKGEVLPDRIRYLGGLVKLQYLFVYPEEKDLVLAGRSEPFDAAVPFRPLGQRTGRPVLHFYDFVTALRTCGPGRSSTAFGCTIHLSKEVIDRVLAKKSELQEWAKNPNKWDDLAEEMGKAGGLQEVQFFNVASTSRLGFVCVEADYLLKRVALGIDRSPLKEFRSYLKLQDTPDRTHRFWFETSYDPLLVSEDGTAFELRGSSIRVSTRRTFTEDQENISAPAKAFVDQFSRHLERLSETFLPFADLANLADLAMFAALIDHDGLHEKVGLDLGWVLDEKECVVPTMAVPRFAPTLVNYHVANQTIIFSSGGVRMSLGENVEQREPDGSGGLKGRAARPEGDEAILTRKQR